MRRGLMAWDPDEIPIAVLKDRVERLQTEIARHGQDAIILYTNFVRSGAVSYLTAFSPYWADGVLLVPSKGEPVFATTLSKRVGSWIQSVKPIGDLINTPAPGRALGERLAGGGAARRVAILELDDFPSGLYGELAAVLPGAAFVDGSDSFAAARGASDAIERRLLKASDSIAKGALQSAQSSDDVGTTVAAVETYARLRGAEEVYVAIAPALDADRRFVRLSGRRPLGVRFAIRATVAYKGCWVRRARTYSREAENQSAIDRADVWFEGLLTRIDAKRSLHDQISTAIASLADAHIVGWVAEAPVGTRPLAVVASNDGAKDRSGTSPALIMSLALDIGGLPWCAAGLAHFAGRSE